MIAQKYRFHGHGSLNYLHRHGSTARAQYFGVKYVQNKKRDSWRLAVVVSKKTANTAIKRTKIRRRLYELARKNMPEGVAGIDMAIMVYDERVGTIEPELLEQMFMSTLNKVLKAHKK